nr:hypothetical protein 109 [Pelagibacteraceae bacterium]
MVRSLRGQTGLGFSERPGGNNAQGGGAAAGLASLGDVFSGLQRNKPDWAGMGATAVDAYGLEERAIRDANTATLNSKISSEAQIKRAEIISSAQKDAARARAQGSMVGSIAKAGIGLLGSVFMSDERTKNTIERIEDGLSTLRQLKPVTYYYNEEYSSSPERIHHGFIAQDYAKVLPDATYYDDSVDRLCIDTGELIALLVRSVQQLESRVTRMEAKAALVEV